MAEEVRFDALIPLIIYFIIIYIIGFISMRYVYRATKREGKGFLKEYLMSDRNLNGFVLAMTLVATYLSAGSFIGGPGTAYTYGLAWVFLAMAQMPTGYFTLGVLGKKFAIIARKINAVTITDFLKERYESKLLVVIVSLSVVFFLLAAMTAQVIGAVRLLEGALGISYEVGLIFFAFTILIYTIIGGFRAVALTDTLQGIVMTVGVSAVIFAAISAGGGINNIIQDMYKLDPGMISPYGTDPEFLTIAYVTSFWVLVGFGVVGLPRVATRAMSYKDSKSLKDAIIYGTIITMILLLGMHLLGAFGAVLLPGIESGDLVVPKLTTHLFPNWIAGLILAGPLAAVMSSIDSQLLVGLGAIVNDVYANIINPKLQRTSLITFLSAIIMGAVVFIMAFDPPDLMVWLNLYAAGGLKATFLWPIVLGIYWKRANTKGAYTSIILGVLSFILFDIYWPTPLGMHPIVLTLVLSLAGFVIVSLLTEKPPARVIQKFWGV
ncbi:sodium/pantothenate symporter [Natranaerofaba carboxydovora]|uniref:sodium/pantothenate symporter n=1 Tax=Natranaerofaba carboxydovora TaxID=2742683 RepID=UPI001F13E13D|nr:sodium/pantothenate symporter [Natranaerofaba carboxydovora]